MKRRIFYTVLKESDHCLKRHYDKEAAITEANRLGDKFPGTAFYVLKTIGFCQIPIGPSVFRVQRERKVRLGE